MEPHSFSFSKKCNFACVERQEDMNYEGKLVKAPLCPERRMRTPVPQQSSLSSTEEGSPWSAQERTTVAKLEQYVNNCDCIKLEIDEVDEYFLGPEYSDVDVKHVVRDATREGRTFFEVFSVKEKGEHLVASQWRWDDCQRQRKSQEEKAWKESQRLEKEDKRKWCTGNEDAARKC